MTEEFATFKKDPEPDTEIWIAENMCYRCIGKHNWFNILMARLLLGWKIKKIKTPTTTK
jgi:hypothetical protein